MSSSGPIRLVFVVLALWFSTINATPIDNGLATQPEISCLSTSIGLSVNTRNPFGGHIYVKNRYSEDACRISGNNALDAASIELPFDSCGVNPRGIFVTVTLVIKFHPVVVTKVDRAIDVRCFYMEAEKTVETDLEVSMITTAFQTQQVPMPICRYEILDSSDPLEGLPLRAALVGRKAYHKWTCDTETVDTFCMLINSCFVEDRPGGDRINTIDTDGCAIDKFIMNNLEYTSDLMAGVETHVFKYPDRPNLYFNCQAKITVKEPGQSCPRPECAQLRRRKRSWLDEDVEDGCWVNGEDLCVDMAVDINVLSIEQDIQRQQNTKRLSQEHPVLNNQPELENDSVNDGFSVSDFFAFDWLLTNRSETPDAVCANESTIKWSFGVATVVCIALTYTLFKVIQRHQKQRKHKQNRRVVVIYGDQIPIRASSITSGVATTTGH